MPVRESDYAEIARRAHSAGIGNTPLREVYSRGDVRIIAKFEGFNRFGSVKDRPAFFMLSAAEIEGRLARGREVIEASSGNTGIALAYISKVMGYRATIFVPASSSEETREKLIGSGQEIVEVEDENSRQGRINIDASLRRLKEAMQADPDRYVNLDQYSNPSNFKSHFYTTGPEVAGKGEEIEYLVSGIGTGGTVTGLGMFLKHANARTRVIAVEPDPDHHIQGLKNLKVSSVPRILEDNMNIIDDWARVGDSAAFQGVMELKGMGFNVGLSSGANYMASVSLAGKIKAGTILTVFPDGAERYQSIYRQKGII
ncbi:MAG: cysteine synthase family protein [Candidatus Thermoplasmatota archaeon]|jgi:cysteine synthase|nr:cysteine synthase family protein [Candidatus Thermoplasmatota archaeon]